MTSKQGNHQEVIKKCDYLLNDKGMTVLGIGYFPMLLHRAISHMQKVGLCLQGFIQCAIANDQTFPFAPNARFKITPNALFLNVIAQHRQRQMGIAPMDLQFRQ
jgi:hypothetical protein